MSGISVARRFWRWPRLGVRKIISQQRFEQLILEGVRAGKNNSVDLGKYIRDSIGEEYATVWTSFRIYWAIESLENKGLIYSDHVHGGLCFFFPDKS